MRLSGLRISRESGGAGAPGMEDGSALVATLQRSAAVVMAALILVATVGVVVARNARPAGADTTFASGQVFASVGGSQVYTFDPTSGNYLSTLTDNSVDIANANPDYYANGFLTVGSAFDASGNFYVTDDDTLGDTNSQVSEFNSSGTQIATYAGLQNPISIAFDGSGNMYVGQQTTPNIAVFSTTGATAGQRLADIGPLQHDYSPGADSIDLSSDSCTIYYTTEGTSIFTYNRCTHTQGPIFNQVPFPSTQTLPGGGSGQNQAFAVKILGNGDVLVADSDAVLELGPTGSVIATYPCSAMSGCGGGLFALSVDPSGTSFWTGDENSGNIYQVNLADTTTTDVMQTISGASGTLFGLSVDNQLEVATSPNPVVATPTELSTPTVTGTFTFGVPTPVSATLTDTTGTPIPNEPVTFSLNQTETCTATTDSNGVATCTITPGESTQPQDYTLTASFVPTNSSQTAPLGSSATSSSVPVAPDTTALTYTGPTTAVNGQPITPSATLTDTSTNTPVNPGQVDFTVGTGTSAQTCPGSIQLDGTYACTVPIVVNQPTSATTVTVTYGGGPYTQAAPTQSVPITVTEPTTLTVVSATSDFADAVTVQARLTDTLSTNPIANEPVTLKLNNTETCPATTDVNGLASCSITPGETAGTYPLTATFGGDSGQPLQLMATSGSANFVVTLEETALAYTGPTTAVNGTSFTMSSNLTRGVVSPETDNVPLAGRTVLMTLGSGGTAQSCTGTTDASGNASCTITVSQSPGPIPVTASFAGDAWYQLANAASTVNIPEGTKLIVNPVTPGTYETPTTVSATLVNTSTNQPVPNEPVTFTVNTQTCTVNTDASGVASCPITPAEPAGSYSLVTTFPGDMGSMPQLLPNTTTSSLTVTQAPTTLTYAGTTSVTNGQPATLSGVLTSTAPSPGTDVSGKTVTFTLGSGSSQQSCTATTNSSGAASCTIASVNQSSGTVGISASYSTDNYYSSSSASSTAAVQSPTTLTVKAGTSDYADAGTVSAVLTNSATGAVIPGEPVTFTMNNTEVCTGTTNASGLASCSVTPSEAAGTYTLRHVVRRRLLEGTAASGAPREQRHEQLRRDARGDGHRLHRTVGRRERAAVHHVGQPHPWRRARGDRQRPVGRPVGADDARLGQHRPELHRHHQCCWERQLHHRRREPDGGHGAHRGLLRR